MFDFYYSYISNSVDNSNTANMWGTFDLGYKMKSEMVPFMGIQYETLKSFNVDSLATSSDSKVLINNSLIWFRVGFENKIFSLRDIAYSLGLHRTPFAKNLFRMLDHSFYFKIIGSYAVTSSSDNAKAFTGTKFYTEVNSRLFNDILFGAFYQITTLMILDEMRNMEQRVMNNEY